MQYLTPELQPKWNRILFGIFQKFIEICEQNNLTYYCVGGTLIGAVRHHGMIPWDDDIDVSMPRPDYDRFREICRTTDLGNYELRCAENTADYYFQFSKLCDKRTTIMEQSDMPCVFGLFIDIFPVDGAGDDFDEAVRIKYKYRKIQNQLEAISTRYRFTTFMRLLGDRFEWGRFVHKLIGFFFRKPYRYILMRRLDKAMRTYDFATSKYVVTYSGVYDTKEIYLRELLGTPVQVPFENLSVSIPEHWDAYLRHFFGDYMQLPPEEDRHYKHAKVFFDLERGLTLKEVQAELKRRRK